MFQIHHMVGYYNSQCDEMKVQMCKLHWCTGVAQKHLKMGDIMESGTNTLTDGFETKPSFLGAHAITNIIENTFRL